MTQKSPYDASHLWQNVSPEIIANQPKAEHMAHVENEWRDSVTRIGQIAAQAAEEGKQEAADLTAVVGAAQAKMHGPQAVEQAAKDYDNYLHPVLPPTLPEATVGNPGERQLMLNPPPK